MKKVGGLANALKKYSEMNASVRVGVLENATYPDGTPVAMVAFWNEYGTKTSPVRAFFRTTVSDQKKNWVLSVQNLMKMHDDPKKVMGLIGEHMRGQIVQSINTWTDPPNAPYTVKIKGFNKPLVHHGIMMRSISYEVNE
nr:MAG TPA: virion morphogenesis protein [Caudoviricetes sp.]